VVVQKLALCVKRHGGVGGLLSSPQGRLSVLPLRLHLLLLLLHHLRPGHACAPPAGPKSRRVFG
jgi:hypothetical protein